MASSIKVVQSVEDDIKCRKPVNVELVILDVRMVCFKLRTGLELVGDFLRNLDIAPPTVRSSFGRMERTEMGGDVGSKTFGGV